MTILEPSAAGGESDSRVAGLCGMFLGLLLVATFAVSYNFPAGPAEADATLAGFNSFRAAFLAGDVFIGLAAVFIGETIALDVLSAAYATGGVSKTVAVIDAQAVIGFGAVEVFGFLLFAAGFAGFGFATIRGRPFPRWLGYVGILAGILFLPAALPVGGSFTAPIAGAVLLLVWIFSSPTLPVRAAGPPPP